MGKEHCRTKKKRKRMDRRKDKEHCRTDKEKEKEKRKGQGTLKDR